MRYGGASPMILGAGVTGLAAGLASGYPLYEAILLPGGICSSYYVRPGEQEPLRERPADEEAYRFEIGGGHWIFGGDPAVLQFIRSLTPCSAYERRSAVYFRRRDLYVPYPFQNHLRFLSPQERVQALVEMAHPGGPATTMAMWLERHFGATLSEIFFHPFHRLYTAGLSEEIAPQDGYKSPVDLSLALRGAFEETPQVGYNAGYLYPREGLDTLARRMAERCDIHYGKRTVKIRTAERVVEFADGSEVHYKRLLSTLPLNRTIEMCDVTPHVDPDPYTSVLVLNIGALRGARCPREHWLYNPDASSGFHRVGFYSNVDAMFLPRSARASGTRVSIYVERAFRGGQRPTDADVAEYARNVVSELQDWEFIGSTEVVHPTWIDVAYTWTRPGSHWRESATALLESNSIYTVGRYARWVFQGIADSIRDGFCAGITLRNEGLVAPGIKASETSVGNLRSQ
jgi:protoporphyrinogen oxidase